MAWFVSLLYQIGLHYLSCFSAAQRAVEADEKQVYDMTWSEE